MKQEVRNISEILNTPGVWFELYLDRDTGIWEMSKTKYVVTLNKKIIEANTGRLIDDEEIKEIDLNNKKSIKYVWYCSYILQPGKLK